MVWSTEVVVWSTEVVVWSIEVVVWSTEVFVWSTEVVWNIEVVVWSTEVVVWSAEVVVWSTEVVVRFSVPCFELRNRARPPVTRLLVSGGRAHFSRCGVGRLSGPGFGALLRDRLKPCVMQGCSSGGSHFGGEGCWY